MKIGILTLHRANNYKKPFFLWAMTSKLLITDSPTQKCLIKLLVGEKSNKRQGVCVHW